MILNLRNIPNLLEFVKTNSISIFKLNVSTLINTLLAFYVMVYVSPIVYIIVFFSGLSFFSIFVNSSHENKAIKLLTLAVFLVALVTSVLISSSNMIDTAFSIILTLISTYFALQYMQESGEFHTKVGMSTSEVLALRFFLVIIACGGYSFYQTSLLQLESEEIFLLLAIAVFGSIIPLFLWCYFKMLNFL